MGVTATHNASVIILSPASKTFVDTRTTTLGPWVIGSALDCLLMGIVLSQMTHFFRNRSSVWTNDCYLALGVTALSILKTMQGIGIVWEQNVIEFANPDVARTLSYSAWWQVSAPLITGITGCLVQSFFCWRFMKLSGRSYMGLPIVVLIGLGVSAVCISTFYIIKANASRKVEWLLVHLVSVSIADILITTGTVYALYSHANYGYNLSSSLVKRLLRIIFEAAIPPALVATVDLILTQTLRSHLLWHLVANYVLQKLYAISLLYTVNSIDDFRRDQVGRSAGNKISTTPRGGINFDLENNSPISEESVRSRMSQVQIQVTTSTVSKVDPSSPPAATYTGHSRRWEKLIPHP